MSIAQSWADSSADAAISGLARPETEALAAPLHSETITPAPCLAGVDREQELTAAFKLLGRFPGADEEIALEWHDAVRFRGRSIYCGGLVIFELAMGGESMRNRLAQVQSIYHHSGTFCIFLNLFAQTSLVTMPTGENVSMDPLLLRPVGAPMTTAHQLAILLRAPDVSLMYPVQRLYPGQSDLLVYLVPE